jgi:iron-sulfur cluster assembly protein
MSNFTNKKIDYLKVTDDAIAAIKEKTSDKEDIFGIKVSIKTRGCSGMAYNISYATKSTITEYDELVNNDKVFVFIDPKVSLFLFNTVLDFVEKKSQAGAVIESGFVFSNPNETGKCGCGESFYV